MIFNQSECKLDNEVLKAAQSMRIMERSSSTDLISVPILNLESQIHYSQWSFALNTINIVLPFI